MCAADSTEIFFFLNLCAKMLFIHLKLDLKFEPTGLQDPSIFFVFRDSFTFSLSCVKTAYTGGNESLM